MKKYLLFLPCLLLSALSMQGQSVKFNDLVYYTGLDNGQVFNTIIQGNAFKQEFTITQNGQDIETFKNVGTKPNTEKIVVGKYVKLYDGTLLRTVTYNSTIPQNIINMIGQARRYGLTLKFRGADDDNNIYLFDNDFYHVSIYLRRDQKSGLVEIKQKEYLGLQ